MVETIETARSGVYVAPKATVYVADELAEDKFEEVKYLYLERLRIAASPEIDEAQFTYHYGRIQREDKNEFLRFEPLEHGLKFVKVSIEDTVGDGDPILWYGVIEPDERDVYGSSDQPTGLQILTAYGLLRMLDKVVVRSSIVGDRTDLREIGVGLAFNDRQRGFVPDRGNRNSVKHEGCYHFIDLQTIGQTWTAYDAAEYLLTEFAPPARDGEPVVPWVLVENGEHLLDWYDLNVATDNRSVKAILDDLINRRRGVGYYVDFVDDTAYVNVFSFNDSELTLAEDAILGANNSQKRLDFELAVDIDRALLRNLGTTQYDEVVACGEFMTSTCTLLFTEPDDEDPQIVPDWTDAEEADYLDGARSETGYDALDSSARALLNAAVRSSDRLSHVWSRWKLSPEWNGTAIDLTADGRFNVAPLFAEDGSAIQPYDAAREGPQREQWIRGLRFESHVLFKHNNDYGGDSIENGDFDATATDSGNDDVTNAYLPPFVMVNFGIENYRMVDTLGHSYGSEDNPRHWSVHVRADDRGPLLQLVVSGKPQHCIGKSDFLDPGTAAEYDELDDPEKQFGFDWQDIIATVTLRLQKRVEERWNANTADDAPRRHKRILYVEVPDARLDYVVPKTVVGIKNNGSLKLTNNGGFLRDDRQRLKIIARAAAQWYGSQRQTLQLTFKQIRNFVTVGDLITDVGPIYRKADVKTPVTALTYDFTGREPKTTLETGYAELDLTWQPRGS